ncbi:MAG: ParB/RepB/Spo0J family partition protein [Verrucomicrobiales bacterium]|nr:ParB/RepB/Spo0J family partition protein [Verrucomicrobiales bacterium]
MSKPHQSVEMDNNQKPAVNRLDMVRQMAASGGSFGLAAEGRKIVPLASIDEDPQNERRTFRNLEGLAASVKTFGILEPPTVFEKPDGRYQIMTGHRRFRAAGMAGMKKIEVLIRKNEEGKTLRTKSIISNVQREDVNPIEMANALQSLVDDNEVSTQSALAELIGKDKTWVSKMLRILSLPATIQEKVATSQLLVSYDAVAEVARIEDPRQQSRLIDFLLSGASVQQVRQQIKAAKSDGAENPANLSAAHIRHLFITAHGSAVMIKAPGKEKFTDAQKIQALEEALEALKAAPQE